jgi:cell division septum initiation protein DivIVA
MIQLDYSAATVEALVKENEKLRACIAELEARIAELGEISDAFLMDGESAVARITELEVALSKAAKRLMHVHSSPRISGAQYKIFAEEAFAALKGERG